jgi:hypothetical protein
MKRKSMAMLLIWIMTGCATGHFYIGEVPREPLDRLWEDHMLAGTSADYVGGRLNDLFHPTTPPEQARGSPLGAHLTTRGIGVYEDKGTAFLGLLQGGGWQLDGGLLGQVEGAASILELYGRRVWPLHAVPLGIGGPRVKPKEEETYDFFLLRRERGARRAKILAKWTIQPSEIVWFVPEHVLKGMGKDDETIRRLNETSDVRGFVKYLPESQEAEVTITGLTHPFVERVKVELK